MDPSIFRIDYRSRKPIYEQLVDSVCELLLRGVIVADEQMPSVRAMSGELAINPNTIQKAYVELERRGILYSIPGRGSFISSDIEKLTDTLKSSILRDAEEQLNRAKNQGIGREDILSVVDKIWR